MNHKNQLKEKVLELIKSQKEIVVFDTETTGLNPKTEQIIQFSAVKGYFKEEHGVYKFEETSRCDEYIKPYSPVSAKITEITQITNEFLMDKPFEDKVFPRIKAFLGKNPVISGYNVPFDIGMLSSLYERQGEELSYEESFDVLKMARELISRDDLSNAGIEPRFKQECIAQLYDIADGVQFHSAIEDTLVCSKLFAAFINEYLNEEDFPKKRLKIFNIYYETRFQHDRNGLWVIGDICDVYYCEKYHQWYCTRKDKKDAFETVDLNALEKDVFAYTGLNSVDEFKNYKGNWKDKTSLRVAKKVTNINLWTKYSLRRVYFVISDESGQSKGYYDCKKKQYSCPGFNIDSVIALAGSKIQALA